MLTFVEPVKLMQNVLTLSERLVVRTKVRVVLMYGSLGGQSFQQELTNILFRDVRLHGLYLSNWIDRLTPNPYHEFNDIIMMLLAYGVMHYHLQFESIQS